MSKTHVDVSELAQSQNLAEQIALGCLSHQPSTAQVIVLTGPLGAGKTQWARFFCQAMGVPAEQVTSPTYVLLHRYGGKRLIYHIDFYRLENSAQVWDLGVDELFEQPVVMLIEWGDKFLECLPADYLAIHLAIQVDGRRIAQLESHGSVQHLISKT